MVFFNEIEKQQAKQLFDEKGYTQPYNLYNKDIVKKINKDIIHKRSLWKKLVSKILNQKNSPGYLNRHLDLSEVKAITEDRNLILCLKSLCRSDLALWRTRIFVKEVGSKKINWHHDKHFQDDRQKFIDLNDTSSHFSVLVALNDMKEDNGAFQVLPRSHKSLNGFDRDLRIKTLKSPEEHFLEELPKEFQSQVETITLKEGQFIIFHSSLYHRSLEYTSGNPRMSIAMRFMAADISCPENDGTGLKKSQYIYIN